MESMSYRPSQRFVDERDRARRASDVILQGMRGLASEGVLEREAAAKARAGVLREGTGDD
jgi:hypothetical protein